MLKIRRFLETAEINAAPEPGDEQPLFNPVRSFGFHAGRPRLRKRGIGAIALLLLVAGNAPAQFKITGFSVGGAGGSSVALESTTGTFRLQRGNPLKAGVGVIRQTMFLEIPGERSSVRIRQSPQVFLVTTEQSLPEGLNSVPFELRLLVRKKGTRELVTSDVSTYVAVTKNRDSSPTVVVDVSRFDEHTFKIVPKLPLLPGEYAFNTSEEVTDPTSQRYQNRNAPLRFRLYCFGVD